MQPPFGKIMRTMLLTAIAILLSGSSASIGYGKSAEAAPGGDRTRATVEKVVGGDTIEVSVSGQHHLVRYLGMGGRPTVWGTPRERQC